MKISLDKQYRTRDGREVKLLMVDGGSNFPVLGAAKKDGIWEQLAWRDNGLFQYHQRETQNDLIEIKPRIKLEKWICVYDGVNGQVTGWPMSSKEVAIEESKLDRHYQQLKCLGCFKIVIDGEEGEGLS